MVLLSLSEWADTEMNEGGEGEAACLQPIRSFLLSFPRQLKNRALHLVLREAQEGAPGRALPQERNLGPFRSRSSPFKAGRAFPGRSSSASCWAWPACAPRSKTSVRDTFSQLAAQRAAHLLKQEAGKKESIPGCPDTGSAKRAYIVRLLSYLPGKTVATIHMSPPLLYELGRMAARMDKTLTEKFQHPLARSLHRGGFIWNLANVPLLEQYIHALGRSEYLDAVKWAIDQFRRKIVPNLHSFRPCIIHGDLNDHNILVDTDFTSPKRSQYRVSGILDFSDMNYGCYVFEVAILIMYMMIESKDPLSVGGHVLAGYESIVPLTEEERDALFLLVSGRFAQSLVMAAYTTLLQPENEEYLMTTSKTGWKHLLLLFEMGQKAVEMIWFNTAEAYAKKGPS
uniref:Hydroxylysine kinase n=1 Tax=Podarcis muralis TaxID=64176 RepID=A0A670JBJ7_PODMU|nr:hydroxylysine kinase isoform X1 [Podarcis muralis]